MATSIPFIHKKDNAAELLKQVLREEGIVVYAEDVVGNGIKLHAAYRDKSFSLILYFSQKAGLSSSVVLEKETDEIGRIVAKALVAPPRQGTSAAPSNPLIDGIRGEAHIGIDESGKGDYFGPLVIAGVCVDAGDEDRLVRAGVKDSKLLSDKQATQVAEKIRTIAGQKRYDVIHISPEKYNELYVRMRNLNRLLAWGHARVLENLLEKSSCGIAVCDQFGDESYIRHALLEKGKAVRLIQTPRAEADIAVAAASILARDTFLKKLNEASEKYGIKLPKGASMVIEVAREFVRTHGESELGKVAKLHFKTTDKVLKGLPGV